VGEDEDAVGCVAGLLKEDCGCLGGGVADVCCCACWFGMFLFGIGREERELEDVDWDVESLAGED